MRILIIIGSLFAALSVLLGAFGAHGLKNRLSMEDLAIFETAVRYQMYHSLGILLMGVASFYLTEKLVSMPAYFFILGIIIFSGSLFLLVITNLRWFGAITPIGGLCLIIGWLLLAYNIYFHA
ncbi:MAG: hypothetical protein CMF99_08685 [Candidatus Marinimicrobia bacterium]|nr:hypothetical protein [Candidatus Neomarinimicrobiota bacterium]|tara:strand:- start:1376 stop:1744 length:369 start_codon:yes stop_codon:yes gene_type:complete